MEMRGIEPRAFHMQSERSTTELHPQTITEPNLSNLYAMHQILCITSYNLHFKTTSRLLVSDYLNYLIENSEQFEKSSKGRVLFYHLKYHPSKQIIEFWIEFIFLKNSFDHTN